MAHRLIDGLHQGCAVQGLRAGQCRDSVIKLGNNRLLFLFLFRLKSQFFCGRLSRSGRVQSRFKTALIAFFLSRQTQRFIVLFTLKAGGGFFLPGLSFSLILNLLCGGLCGVDSVRSVSAQDSRITSTSISIIPRLFSLFGGGPFSSLCSLFGGLCGLCGLCSLFSLLAFLFCSEGDFD